MSSRSGGKHITSLAGRKDGHFQPNPAILPDYEKGMDMSTTAFADMERAVILREQQAEVALYERARVIDQMSLTQAAKESLADALRLHRAVNGPTPLELANARIAELEQQRDETAHEITEWVQDLQAYFPGATTMHDVYRGIEAMEAERNKYRAAIQKTINENGHLADGDDCTLIELKRAIGAE